MRKKDLIQVALFYAPLLLIARKGRCYRFFTDKFLFYCEDLILGRIGSLKYDKRVPILDDIILYIAIKTLS